MPKLLIAKRNGDEIAIDGKPGVSVMEVIRDAAIDELFAICGGCCSCATCHVYVDPAFFDELPPIERDEKDLLECLDHRRSNSRLSCQIPFSEALDGLKVVIAPEE